MGALRSSCCMTVLASKFLTTAELHFGFAQMRSRTLRICDKHLGSLGLLSLGLVQLVIMKSSHSKAHRSIICPFLFGDQSHVFVTVRVVFDSCNICLPRKQILRLMVTIKFTLL